MEFGNSVYARLLFDQFNSISSLELFFFINIECLVILRKPKPEFLEFITMIIQRCFSKPVRKAQDRELWKWTECPEARE